MNIVSIIIPYNYYVRSVSIIMDADDGDVGRSGVIS